MKNKSLDQILSAKFIKVRILFFKSNIIQVREIDDMRLACLVLHIQNGPDYLILVNKCCLLK